jgi:hypothetical protein
MGLDVIRILREQAPKIDWSLTDAQNIAGTALLWNSTVCIVEKENRKPIADAHEVLSKWAADRLSQDRDNPSGDIKRLAEALEATRVFVRTLPPRQAGWAMPAYVIWQAVGHVLEKKGHHTGTAPGSIAIRIVVGILSGLGYPTDVQGATPGAVSAEITKQSCET